MELNIDKSDTSKSVYKEKLVDLRKQYCKLADINDINFNAISELEKVNKKMSLLTK